jgi:hypothetical protein
MKKKLKKSESENKAMLLVVRGDHNDADFVTKVTPITEKVLERFLPLIEAIEKFQPYKGFSAPVAHRSRPSDKPLEWTHDHNWPVGEYGYREDLGCKTITELYGDLAQEFDDEYVPHGGEQAGYSLHTIVEIFIVKLDKKLFTNSNHYKGWAIL